MSNAPWHLEYIKATVLTDVLNWKTIEKSYEDQCKRFRGNALRMTHHQWLFNEFSKETQKLAEAQTNINEIVFNVTVYLRYRILHDVISKVPINTSYKGLCEMIGNVDYPKFEFWYYRFSNGQRELDYDQSKDPKQLTFSDLPIDVIEKIVGVFELKQRCTLRRISHSFQRFVDSSKLVIGNISLIGEHRSISVVVDDIKKEISCQDSAHVTSDACCHLSIFVRNPKLQLGLLDLNIHHCLKDDILVDKLFNLIPYQLHVKSLKIRITTKRYLMDFIRCLKPKVLRKLDIRWDNMQSIDILDLVDSEQWKQAKEVVIISLVSCDFADFFHFKSFDIRLARVSMESMLQLRDGISKSSNFEWCRVKSWRMTWFIDCPSTEEVQIGLELEKHVHNNMEYFVYNIPNSTEILVFSFFDNSFNRDWFIKKSTCSASF